MATQKTQIRQRLGAEIARLRVKQGMATQADLAGLAGLSVRSVWAAENGEKVAPRTLRKIEAALGLPPGAVDEFLEKQGDTLAGPVAQTAQIGEEELGPLDEVLSASLEELLKIAAAYAWYEARRLGRAQSSADKERFMRWAMDVRAGQQGGGIKPHGPDNSDGS